MIRTARSRSFLFAGRIYFMRLPYTLPNLTITPVDIMLSTSFCAVPAFIRVEPEITSGPTSGEIAMSAMPAMRELGLQERAIVSAPSDFAYSSAPATYAAEPLR